MRGMGKNLIIFAAMDYCCGTFGRTDACNSEDQTLESQHRQNLKMNMCHLKAEENSSLEVEALVVPS